MVVVGNVSKDYTPRGGSSSVDGLASKKQCQSVEEWRSREQVENGTPSTSPLYWDSDDDDDSGPKPSDLYVKHTWKIEKFSQISKRELKSDAFEIGGYKWYILIYPQGCDACNHLSLFLCVGNHDKLLPGWGHFALFTISVENKDPMKNKYNDTLHRFCKKEHDWGWKKFIELTKVMEGFVTDDTLTIKAQVQVIREKAHRPFRCLDCQYRRELIQIYLSAVEKSCAEFVNERRQKLQTLIGDRAKWSSFHSFWLGIDPITRQHMSRDKTDAVLKEAVKNFFIEKEVLSTLVMDSLHSGLRALKSQSKIRKPRASALEKDELPAPVIFIEKDMFVLADDVFRLLERASLEFPRLPLPSKEDKGLSIRAKGGCSGDEFSNDSIFRDERRLTELGRRTLEIFVLAHIFSQIEIAYQEAVALKRQEELIREEEEAEQAESERRERRAKKKQARQKRNNRKGKDKGKDEKSMGALKEKHQSKDCVSDDRVLEDFSSEHSQQVDETSELREGILDISDPRDDGAGALQPDVEDRDSSPLNWDTDTSEIDPTAEASRGGVSNDLAEKQKPSIVDDSSSTCSTDSVPSVVVNGPYKGKSPNGKTKRNPSNRGKSQQNKDVRNISTSNRDTRNSSASNKDMRNNPTSIKDVRNSSISNADLPVLSGSCAANGPKSEGKLHLKDGTQRLEQQLASSKKEFDVRPVNKVNKVTVKDQDSEKIVSSTSEQSSSSVSPVTKPSSFMQSAGRHTTTGDEQASNTPIQYNKSISGSVKSPENLSISEPEALKHTSEATSNDMHQPPSMSRPSSAPVIPAPKPTIPLVSTSQPAPQLGRLDPKPSLFTQNFEPQSYRNAAMGIKTAMGSSTAGFASGPALSSSAPPATSSQAPSSFSPISSFHPGFSFATGNQDRWTAQPLLHFRDNLRNGKNLEPVGSSRQTHGAMPDEFPHIDIINDLLNEDLIVGMTTSNGHQRHDDFHPMNQQYVAPGNFVTTEVDPMINPYQFNIPVPDEYYYDSFVPLQGFGDSQFLQPDFVGYDNGLIRNPWPVNGADLLSFGGVIGANGYAYPLPEYSANGFNMMFQPANGI